MTDLKTPSQTVQQPSAQQQAAAYQANRDQQPRKDLWLFMPIILFFGLAIFVIWAAYFEIDQSVRANGQIIPSARTQIIQAADGGVLAELLVREGQSVVAGQKLAVLEKQRAQAKYEESRSLVLSLSASLNRARAQTLGQEPVFGDEFEDFPEFIEMQKNLFAQTQTSLNDELHALQISLQMAEEELKMNQNLLNTGDASKLEVMRAQRQVSELTGKISAVNNQYLQEAHKEVTKLEAELDMARHKLEAQQSILAHTDIVAPVAGIVKYLKLNTLGGVLRAGDELMQISPTQGDLILEVKVSPVDIGQLELNMPVSIKLDAFDYSIYGSLDGTLSYISSDTLTEQTEGESHSYYRAQISVDTNSKNFKFASTDLKPGMTSTVDIQTGKRTVLHYLSKPITRAFGGAFNER